ncbi:MAG: DUF2460 domain-containing protein [Hyphomonadaceae bacterium]
MNGFHEIRLPLAISLGATGGPERLTDVVRLASGAENRNARWAGSRRRWDVGGATLRLDAAYELIAFFEARGGRLNGFRFRDPVDWKSCAPGATISASDQIIGTGDGETTTFQLVKRYVSGEDVFARPIRKPVDDSVVVALDGIVAAEVEVDAGTGVVAFSEAPPSGASITAGFEFDTPARFDVDRLDMSIVGHGAARVMRTPLVEIQV